MNSLYISSKQAAELLGFPKKTTVRLLQARGVVPVDLGVGAKRGLRWNALAVKNIADTLQAEAQAKVKVPRRKKITTTGYVLGKSVSELYMEFNMAVQ